MKKLNYLTLVKVGLSLSLILPGMTMAEEYPVSKLESDTSKTSDALKSFIKTNGKTDEKQADPIDELLANVKKNFEVKKEETELRDKVRNWVKKNNGIDALQAQMKATEQKELKKRGTDLKQAEALSAQLSQTQSQANPADFSTKDLPKECRKGVDFQQFNGMMEMMRSQAGQRLASQAQGMLSDSIKENKEEQKKKLAQLVAEFKEFASRDKNEAEKLAADAIQGAKGDEARVNELKKEKLPGVINQHKEKQGQLVDSFAKFMETMTQIGDDDKKLAVIRNDFTSFIDKTRQNARLAGADAIDQLHTNCESQRKAIRTEIDKTQKWLEPVVGVDAAALDAQAQYTRLNRVQCTDVTQDVDAVLASGVSEDGTDLNATLASISKEKSPVKLMAQAVQALGAVASIHAQAGRALQPLKDDCSDAAKSLEAVKQRGQQVSQQQRAAAGANGARGATGQASGNGSFWKSNTTASRGASHNTAPVR